MYLTGFCPAVEYFTNTKETSIIVEENRSALQPEFRANDRRESQHA